MSLQRHSPGKVVPHNILYLSARFFKSENILYGFRPLTTSSDLTVDGTVFHCKKIKKPPKKQKCKIHKKKCEGKCEHIFFGILQVVHRNIFLHHFLVQPRHCNGE